MSGATDAVAESDREAGAPHPRDTFAFIGHEAAESALADAVASGRMHHAWLLSGPKGVGKATLSHRLARILLGAHPTGPRPLDVDPEDPVVRRLAARAHGDLHVLRRGVNERGRLRGEITVDDARALVNFFTLKAGEGGWRIAIVDSADELNRNAANAILKTLEEPPPRTVLVLISHAPGRLLPTIRSRCRKLDLRPLPEDAVRTALTQARGESDETALRLAGGSPGRAIALAAAGAGDMQAALAQSLEAASKQGARALLPEAFKTGDRSERLTLYLSLLRDWIRRAIAQATGAEPPGDPLMSRLCGPNKVRQWAETYEALLALEREWDGLDMDATHAFARTARLVERALA